MTDCLSHVSLMAHLCTLPLFWSLYSAGTEGIY